MAKKTNGGKSSKTPNKLNVFKNLKRETSEGVLAIIFFVIAAFLLLASMKRAGFVGNASFTGLSYLMGIGFFLLPILLITLGVSFLRPRERSVAFTQAIGAFIFALAGLGLITIGIKDGGIIGTLVSMPLIKLFDVAVTVIVLVGFLAISSLLIFDSALPVQFFLTLPAKLFRKKKSELDKDADVKIKIAAGSTVSENDDDADEDGVDEKVGKNLARVAIAEPVISAVEKSKGPKSTPFRFSSQKPYTPPPMELLEFDRGKAGVGDIKANSNVIKRTLQNFGIDVEMDEVSIGPSVTRYSLKPAEGVKLSRILGLQNDLSLALAAHPIRIEAPIPGKSLVGIEIPNTVKTIVGLGSLLSAEEFSSSEKPLLLALGKGVSGKSHFSNLAKMPHLLIAGATGSGKSVSIHALITSLLYRNSPEHLRFIMIDPKRVELTLYNGIPHLLTPVITDAKKTILSLKWAAKEMDRRFDLLQSVRVRDIESYHKTILEPALAKLQKKDSRKDAENADENIPESMPYIVIIVDELADIMQSYPRELEAAIVRLAQMSRAVGIHLILSTQRPSVNVITGIIKANVPSRIAFQVASQIDSRTILDGSGAEKLLGAGDMLYLSGDMSKPQRVQSAFIGETEVKNVVKFLKDSYKDEIVNEIDITADAKEAGSDAMFESLDADEPDDDLYEEARDIVMKAQKASTSYLQRKLRIGYARAARLIDMLEERGVVGSGSGAKPRDVIGNEGFGQADGLEEGNDVPENQPPI
jgi:S-DNA-T family DNA segregation ATPase FtsK/SpoIIIE